MKRLDNKVAIVTGASKGIGAGIAKAFGAEGAAVVVNYARDQAGAERVVREITGKGGRAIAVQGFVAEGGSIINIGSTASVAAYPTLSIYVASKSAVNGLTRVLSKEFGPRKIRVNALNPGGTETEGTHAAGVMGTESKKQIIASTSFGRVGQPEDIARVAVFLGSDDAGWLTGETIFANGGHK